MLSRKDAFFTVMGNTMLIGLAGAISIYELPTVTIEMLFLPFVLIGKNQIKPVSENCAWQKTEYPRTFGWQSHPLGFPSEDVRGRNLLNPMRPTRIREMPIAIPKKTNNIDPVQIGLHDFSIFCLTICLGVTI